MRNTVVFLFPVPSIQCVKDRDTYSRYSFLFSILSQSGSATSPLSICQFMDVAVMSAFPYTHCAAQCVNKREQA